MPRTPEANQLVKDKRRKQILSTALVLFCKKGYEAVTMDSIAQEANISHGLIYHYFKKKSDILSALIESSKEKFNAFFDLDILFSSKGADFFQKMTDFFLSSISMGEEYVYYVCLLLNLRLSPEIYSENSNLKYFKFAENNFKMAQEEGIFEKGNVKEFLLCYLYLLKSIVDQAISNPTNFIVPSSNVVMNLLRRSS